MKNNACHYAKCHYTECHNTCNGTFELGLASAICYLPYILCRILLSECNYTKCLYTECCNACNGTFEVGFASVIFYLPFVMQNIVVWMSFWQMFLYWLSWRLRWYLWGWVCFCHLLLAIYNSEHSCLIVIMPSFIALNVIVPAMVPLRLGLLLSFATCQLKCRILLSECHYAKCLYNECCDACSGTLEVGLASAICYLPVIMQNIVYWMSWQVSLYWMLRRLRWYLWG